MHDLISRQAAIDAINKMKIYRPLDSDRYVLSDCLDKIVNLPSAQPEIIRCKDCKYRDENWRRVSVRWLPCMDVRTGSNWYCGSAERGEQYDEQRSN